MCALLKTKEINSDVSANYWNIEGFNYHKPSRALQVNLCLYTSEESRTAGDQPIHTEHLLFNDVSSSDLEENVFVFLYQLLKADHTVLPVLVSEEVPEVTENDPETGELIIVTPKVPAVYKSFFEDAEDLV